MLRFVLFLALAKDVAAGSEEVRITNENEFENFVNDVSEGADEFERTTVYLDSDLSLSEIAEPIGNDTSNYFRGVFDGQGHIISNLKINSSSEYAGLFRYSTELTIRNVILDSSCSITSSYSDSGDTYVGGIIGYCKASSGHCNIENIVNMANVIFGGDINDDLYLGGIAGYLSSLSSIKNCANYGSVTHSGASRYSYIGGIVGYTNSSSSYYAYVQNSLNYGTITHNGTSPNTLYIGGIVGYGTYTYIENCVSAGKIPTQNTPPEDNYIGGIVGYANSNVHINYCYYTSDVGISNLYGAGTPESTTGTSTSSTNVDSDLVSKLNNNATSCNWNKWLLNANKVPVSFVVNYGKEITLNSQIILLPNLADTDKSPFNGWYNNSFCSKPFQESSVTKNTTLYGLYGKIVKVTFDTNGGDKIEEEGKNVLFNGTYGELPVVHKSGYTFTRWSTDGNENVTSETIVTKQDKHTLRAHWKSSLSFTAGIVAAVIVIIVIIVVVTAIVVLAIALKTKTNSVDEPSEKSSIDVELDNQPREEYCRIIATSMEEKEATVASENSQGVLINLYPQDYEKPIMGDALLAVGLTGEQAEFICSACEIVSQRASKGGKLTEKFTKEDAAAIAMYTYDFGPKEFESNPYRIINKSLIGRNFNSLQKASGLLYLLMTALRKLPKYTGKTLYRGVRGEVNLDKDHYQKGNVITWSALSSTSPDVEATKAFLAKGSKSGKALGTLFIIDDGWGYNIQPYSLFPDEIEILLEPERLFRVMGVVNADLTIINLQMLNTPLSIPEVFGGK